MITPECSGYAAQQYTEKLAQILGEISGTHLDSHMIQGGSTDTSGGLALSPYLAAKCITLATRTRQFFKGVNQFFCEMATRIKALNILYAGCGPYAALKVFEAAQLPNVSFKGGVADAICWQPEDETTEFDLFASETMNMALKREPQVAIFTHLEQFLKPHGALIPQQISIIASVFNRTEFHEIGAFYRLNRETSAKFREQNQALIKGEILLPSNVKDSATNLLTSTEIQTYGEHFIYPNETDITTDNQYHYLDFSQCPSIPYCYTDSIK